MQILLMDKKFKSSLESFKKLIASGEHDRSIVDGLFKTERELDSLKDEVTKTLMDFLEYNSSHKHIFEIRQQLSISDVYESFGDYGAGPCETLPEIEKQQPGTKRGTKSRDTKGA